MPGFVLHVFHHSQYLLELSRGFHWQTVFYALTIHMYILYGLETTRFLMPSLLDDRFHDTKAGIRYFICSLRLL